MCVDQHVFVLVHTDVTFNDFATSRKHSSRDVFKSQFNVICLILIASH